ncbi:hypothetical protein NCCNTM_10290 [Mycolicibacterium sp. NCC-Tsukiji]|nr:hypothetical protein NCCNTM_10290 [Mycolicibacterium sp. NCC-Tsukiji]
MVASGVTATIMPISSSSSDPAKHAMDSAGATHHGKPAWMTSKPGLEGAAVTWQAGQHQPDALAALVVAHDVLVHSAGRQVHIVSPLDVARRAREGTLPPPPAWMTRRIGG